MKKTDTQKAIEALEAKVAVLNLAISELKDIQAARERKRLRKPRVLKVAGTESS